MGNPSTGYEGKGFLAVGTAVATSVYIDELRRLATRMSRFKVTSQANVVFSRKTGDLVYTVSSNLRPALASWKAAMIQQAVAALNVAGEAGVQAAQADFEAKKKGTSTIKPSSKTDTTDIPSNIGFEHFGDGTVFGITIGPKRPSVKLIAQEAGLF